MSLRKKPAEFEIAELSHDFGVTYRALRFYEGKGLLSPRRGGRLGRERFYTNADRERLARILEAKRLGFTVTEIKALLDSGDRPSRNDNLPLTAKQIAAQLAYLEAQKSAADAAIADLRERLAQLVGQN